MLADVQYLISLVIYAEMAYGNAMDLRHARTFVTVAELGTVSRAALRLRIAQPALSRQITGLEQELGLKLFDRIGRRLVLTSEGEQLVSDYRGLLNYAGAIGERAQTLRRGDTGVLKVAGSPQHIESVLSTFLHRYAQRYPNVEIQLSEAAGLDVITLLERNEIHLGQKSNPMTSVSAVLYCTMLICLQPAIRRSFWAKAAPSTSASSLPIGCCSWIRASSFARSLTPLAAFPGSNRTSSSKATLHIPCWRWRKPGTGWRLFRPSCERVVISCVSSA